MLSELQAVNVMLSAVGSSPVNSITGQVSSDVSAAKAILEEVRLDVLLKGWNFNTERNVGITPKPDGRMRLPNSTLRVDLGIRQSDDVDLVQRGEYLYDRRHGTYTFKGPLKVDVILDLKWDELPQVARRYIAVRAARQFLSRMDGDEKRFRMAQIDEMNALATLQQYETDVGDFNIFDNDTSRYILYRGL